MKLSNTQPEGQTSWGHWRLELTRRLLGSSYASGALAISGGILLAQAISFVGGLLVSRFCYSPAAQDVQAGFAALATTLVPLATLRYDVGIVMPEDETSAHHLFRLSLTIGVAAAALSVLATPICQMLGWKVAAALIWMPVVLLGQAVTMSVIGCCNRLHLFGMQTTSKVVQAAVFPLTAALTFWWRGPNPLNLPAAYALSTFLGGTVIIRALQRAGQCPPVRRVHFDLREMASVARRYRLLPLVNLPMYVLNMASLAVLVWAMQSFAAGTSACFMLIMQILRVPSVLLGMAIGQVYTARAARLVTEPQALRNLTHKTLAGLSLFALPMGLVFWLVGPWLFTTGYGEPWRQAGEFSRWLGWGAAAGILVTPFAMLPTILHSNLGQLLMALGTAVGRCLLAWLAVRTRSAETLVVGSTVIDVVAGVIFLGYVSVMLRRRASLAEARDLRQEPPVPIEP